MPQQQLLPDVIGNTPLLYLRKASELTGCHIYGKAEFMNPGGSVKDRTALGIVRAAEQAGELQPGGVIVEAPVCNARVHICEVDRLYWVIARLPSHDIFRLRDDLLDIVRRPLPWPPIPEPGRAPLRAASSKRRTRVRQAAGSRPANERPPPLWVMDNDV